MDHIRALLAVAAILACTASARAAPLFTDLPENYARPAVESLSKRGVVGGYPDGTFKGGRAATRYEVAQIIARVIALEEKTHAGLATPAELEELKRILGAIGPRVEDVGTRTRRLEAAVESLKGRARNR